MLAKACFLIFPILLGIPKAYSNEILDQTKKVAEDTANQLNETLNQTRLRREQADYFVFANYSPIDLLIPGKSGLSFGGIRDVDHSWEFEYLSGSISVPFLIKDLGKMTDKRFSYIKRSYFGGNSFNFNYGLSYFDFSLMLGDELLNRISGGTYPSLDLVEVQSLGFNIGIGNRWVFNKNISFGIDWLSWSQPIYTLKSKSVFLDYASNPDDKEDVENGLKTITYFPRLTILKLQLGILF